MAEESVQARNTAQATNIDGAMRARINTMSVQAYEFDAYGHDNQDTNTTYYDELYAQSHENREFIAFNAMPQLRHNFDPKQAWSNRNLATVVCYHCGGKGHQTGDCPLITQEQTLPGKQLWAARNRARGNDWPYDKAWYVANKFIYPVASTSQNSSSSSLPSSSTSYRGRGGSRGGGRLG